MPYKTILTSKLISNPHKLFISSQSPPPTFLSPEHHRDRQANEKEIQHRNRNKSISNTTALKPATSGKGKDSPNSVIDNTNTYHSLQNHLRISVHQIRHTQISRNPPSKPYQSQAYIRHWPVPSIPCPNPKKQHSSRGDNSARIHHPKPIFRLSNPIPIFLRKGQNEFIRDISSPKTPNNSTD